MNFETMQPFDNWEEMLDAGFIQSITRKMPAGYWDDTSYYHIVFWDGTKHDFYEPRDIVRFANCLLQFYRDRD